MRVVVVGFGSIGKRHVNNLLNLGIADIILLRNRSSGNDLGLSEIFQIEDIKKLSPDFVIVSNPTYLHFKTLCFLLQNQFNVLCEKPVVSKKEDWVELRKLLSNYQAVSRVTYNLRYHPCIEKIKDILESHILGRINYARFFVGQYLPDWRPNSNHLLSYSAHKDMGGGVALDLIHEIDIAEYLVGKPNGEVQFLACKISDVTIDSHDIAEIVYKTKENEIVNIHLDYLYRGYSRNFLISGSEMNAYCDLLKNEVTVLDSNNAIVDYFNFPNFKRNDMYKDLIKDFISVVKGYTPKIKLPSFDENESVLMTCFKVNN